MKLISIRYILPIFCFSLISIGTKRVYGSDLKSELLRTINSPSQECTGFQSRALNLDDVDITMYLRVRQYLVNNFTESKPTSSQVSYSMDMSRSGPEGEINMTLKTDDIRSQVGFHSSEFLQLLSLAHFHNLCELDYNLLASFDSQSIGGSSNNDEVRFQIIVPITESCNISNASSFGVCSGKNAFECLVNHPEYFSNSCQALVRKSLTIYVK